MNLLTFIKKSRDSALLNRMHLVFIIAVILAGYGWKTESQSDAVSTENKVKAAYVYNFTRFVNWTNPESGQKKETIRIGILGSESIAELLKEAAAAQNKKNEIVVQSLDNSSFSPGDFDILYIDNTKKSELKNILAKTRGHQVLTVSDLELFTRMGGIIGFVKEDKRIKIEINLELAKKEKLQISAKLIEVARLVSGE
ncbi:MAG: hypothetical protein FMNOHCHN_03174 [Ignavibacteriaceae bacterium]|nr:hypothetical protein [Ignavibacteriaceae bacterium]